MSPNLLELVQNYFLGSTVRQISTAFDEPEDRLSAALRRVVPLVLGGLLTRVQEPGGAAELTTWAQQVHNRGLLGDLSSLLAGLRTAPTAIAPAAGRLPTRGADMMRALLGADYGPALAGISQQAGVRTTTVSSLFSVAVAVVLGLLGRHIAQHSLDASGLGSYLGSQRDDILGALAALPAGLGQGTTRLAAGAPATSVAPVPMAPSPGRDSPILMRPVAAAESVPVSSPSPGRDSPIPMRPSEPAAPSAPAAAPGIPAAAPSAPAAAPGAPVVAPSVPVATLGAPATTPSAPMVAPSVPAAATAQPVGSTAPARPALRPAAPAARASRRWPWFLLLAVGLAVIGYFMLNRRPQATAGEPVAAPATPGSAAPAARVAAPNGQYEATAGTYRYEVGADTTLRLPTGAVLTVGSRSAEAQLWQLLTDSPQSPTAAQTLSGIPLDRVYFDPGQATLTSASQAQLSNLAALLAAFPRATLKFGGFTDNQGPAEASLLLSADRANAVRRMLVAQGVAPTRVAAQGYGQTHPVASNATPTGQAQNRRVAVLLTSK